MHPWRTTRLAAALALAAALGGRARADEVAVKTASKEGIGTYLTDASGRTLYVFKKDSPGKSACAGPCVGKWPLFYREHASAAAGVEARELGTITRDDGKKQTTYRGMPLYYFADDKAAADTSGEGFKDVWYVAKP